MQKCLFILTSYLLLTFPSALLAADIHKTERGTISVEQIATDIDTPWAMAMLPNGELLVTLRGGELIIIDPAQPKTQRLVQNLPKIEAIGQGGLLDVVLDRDFEANKRIYFTFAHAENQGRVGTAIAAAILENGIAPSLKNVKILYSMKKKTNGGRHFGSRIVQANDGTLFFTIGDRGDRPRAQDPFDAAGSVIRINTDGTVPKDNPFVDNKDALPEIWSIGHRNPQGATLNDTTGELWTLAHGAKGGDEINIPKAGKNYGWPVISYGKHYSGAKIGLGVSAEGFEQPIYYWDPSIAPSGFDFYQGNKIPFWKGNLFAGSLKFGKISRLEVEGNRITHEEQLFDDEYGRIRDIRAFLDGALWFLTDSDEGAIYRITTR